MSFLSVQDLDSIVATYSPGSLGLLLTGSYARGDASEFSDVDIIRIVPDISGKEKPLSTLLLCDERIVSLTNTTLAEIECDMFAPQTAIFVIPALRQGKIIFDPQRILLNIQRKASEFEWSALKPAAGHYISREITEFAEEVFKIINAIRRTDESAAMIGLLGLCIGMPRILSVHFGAFVPTENSHYQMIQELAGNKSNWTHAFRLAQGMTVADLNDPVFSRAIAALSLYAETIEICREDLEAQHLPIIEKALAAIFHILENTA